MYRLGIGYPPPLPTINLMTVCSQNMSHPLSVSGCSVKITIACTFKCPKIYCDHLPHFATVFQCISPGLNKKYCYVCVAQITPTEHIDA